jgi:hypothetical protein
MEAYAGYRRSLYPGSLSDGAKHLTVEGNERAIAAGRQRLSHKTV